MTGRLEVPGTLRIPVAVLAERRPGVTPWAEWSWRAVEVLEEAPPVPPWTLLREEAGRSLFFAGTAEVTLHPTDTANYRDNLAATPPLVWVVLRPGPGEPGFDLHLVTLDPGEAETYAESGNDLLESLPLPPGLRAAAETFVAQHHVERGFHKRRRDRLDPQAMSRRRGGGDGEG
ncbi:DUF3305 domain-containing protein [Paracraurococcus ruber]|uniref:Molybdopterin-guanine dinucleotide biosynthesis protein A n=1 Tax=Paracraurococcus ruber TaxID=77675 RepID=A0ABS1CS16_9PROT|nr:DUF3305 domain-containing protein [Paracraurococcus ruber]MBK1657251.1 molybdopterin-guanine dinucleotide biosynthesis protein A [Paracraurococcus ruber]TDG32372.1 DUF3305 domain-containing protein [Paracraurococcus ruber]